MTKWARAVAWFWLIVDGYASVSYLFGVVPPLIFGLHFGLTFESMEAFHSTVDIGILIAVAAIALLGQVAWGWWMLLVNAAIGLLVTIIMVFSGLVTSASSQSTPFAEMLMYGVTVGPLVASIIVLTGDPPWKWTSPEPCEPADDPAPPSAEPSDHL